MNQKCFMKSTPILLISFLLISGSISSFAIVEKSILKQEQTPVLQHKIDNKLAFFQKIALKKAKSRLSKIKEKEDEYKDDKLASLGFWTVIGSLTLAIIANILNIAFLTTVTGILFFVGFIICVLAW